MNDASQKWADEHAGELISGLEDSTREDVSKTISDGFREGLTPDELADRLDEMYAFGEARSDLIAITEAQRANGAGNAEGLRQASSAGVILKKEWVCDPDPCEDCKANEDQGLIDVDDTFDSGDDAEPAHPNCQCYVQGVVQNDDKEEGGEDGDDGDEDE